MKHGPRIGRLCDCLRGTACNTFFLRCYWPRSQTYPLRRTTFPRPRLVIRPCTYTVTNVNVSLHVWLSWIPLPSGSINKCIYFRLIKHLHKAPCILLHCRQALFDVSLNQKFTSYFPIAFVALQLHLNQFRLNSKGVAYNDIENRKIGLSFIHQKCCLKCTFY